MAASLALISAVLLSQIATSMAATSPLTIELPCSSYTNGCSCDAVGLADNETASDVVYTSDREGQCCKFITPTKNCREWLSGSGNSCGTKMIDVGALKTAAGDSPSTTCCKEPPTVTCADVKCTARRRRAADMWKAKANAATTACTSEDDCETKCCEKDMTTCMYASESGGNNTAYSCGTDKVRKEMDSSTCSGGSYTHSYTSTASMKVSDEASYQSTCCKAKSSCPSSPSCPSHMEKSSGTTTYMHSEQECCTVKATSCVMGAGCTDYSSQGGDSCGVGAITVCKSSLCDANQVLDTTKEFATGDDDAAKKTKCCIAKGTGGGRKCKDWVAAAKAEQAKKAGNTSDAHVKSASLAVLVFGAFAVKFGL